MAIPAGGLLCVSRMAPYFGTRVQCEEPFVLGNGGCRQMGTQALTWRTQGSPGRVVWPQKGHVPSVLVQAVCLSATPGLATTSFQQTSLNFRELKNALSSVYMCVKLTLPFPVLFCKPGVKGYFPIPLPMVGPKDSWGEGFLGHLLLCSPVRPTGQIG